MNKMLIALTAVMALSSNAFAAEEAGFGGVGAVGSSTIVAAGVGAVVVAAAVAAANDDGNGTATSTVTASASN